MFKKALLAFWNVQSLNSHIVITLDSQTFANAYILLIITFLLWQDKKHDKEMVILQNDLEDKLDRSELQPLREYLGTFYWIDFTWIAS